MSCRVCPSGYDKQRHRRLAGKQSLSIHETLLLLVSASPYLMHPSMPVWSLQWKPYGYMDLVRDDVVFIVFDTETTGLNFWSERIVQLGAKLYPSSLQDDTSAAVLEVSRQSMPEATPLCHLSQSSSAAGDDCNPLHRACRQEEGDQANLFNAYVASDVPLSPKAAETNGLTDEWLAENGRPFQEVRPLPPSVRLLPQPSQLVGMLRPPPASCFRSSASSCSGSRTWATAGPSSSWRTTVRICSLPSDSHPLPPDVLTCERRSSVCCCSRLRQEVPRVGGQACRVHRATTEVLPS